MSLPATDHRPIDLSRCFIGLILYIFSFLLAGCHRPPDNDSLQRALQNQDIQGYRSVLTPRTFTFPRDHAAHAGYKNEWWYLTGHLMASGGRHFGYQVTFFRIALTPDSKQRESNWATDHVWMAHAAITDIDTGQYWYEERFSREAADLAGHTTSPLSFWLDDWRIVASGNDFPWKININNEHFSLALTITPEKKVVLQGEQGLSRKSPAPGNASYYYSITRLASSGQIIIGGKPHQVTGSSWLDREWGTSLLDKNQQGWDWFSLQFHSGEEMMFYQLRQKDGDIDPSSLGSWVDPESQKTTIHPQDIQLTPLSWWQAPSGANYPIRWRIRLNTAAADTAKEWIVQAAIPNQWLNVSIKYWEGAIIIFDAKGKKELGRGYLEMTGYE